jgi:hypothetical protein
MGGRDEGILQGLAFAISVVGLLQPVGAKVIDFKVLRTEPPAFEGRTFAAVGTYDRIIARATIAVAPDDPHNSVIVDIDRAPRNAHGLIEAVSDVEILRPTIAASGNRRLFYEVVNRGNKLGIALFNDGAVINDLAKAADAGNGFLMKPRLHHRVERLAGGYGRRGRASYLFAAHRAAGNWPRTLEVVFDHLENPALTTLSYPAADLDPAHAKITVRSRTAPDDLSVRFDGPNRIAITRPAGFDAGAIYELIYLAKGSEGDGGWVRGNARYRLVPSP